MNESQRALRFRKALEDKKTNCYDLEKKCDVKRQTMYLILKAKTSPKCDTIIMLEDALGLERGALL